MLSAGHRAAWRSRGPSVPGKTHHIQPQGQFAHPLPCRRALRQLLCLADTGRVSTGRWSHNFPGRELISGKKTDQVLTVTPKCCLGGRGASPAVTGPFQERCAPQPKQETGFSKMQPFLQVCKNRWEEEQAMASFPSSQTSPTTEARRYDLEGHGRLSPVCSAAWDTSSLLRGHLKAPSLQPHSSSSWPAESCFKWDWVWLSFGNLRRPQFGTWRFIQSLTDAN